MQRPTWFLVVVGVAVAVTGLAWVLAPSIPWLGKLPGAIVVERENVRFYFPPDDEHPAEPAADGHPVAGAAFFAESQNF
jgi:hypothetical protein